MQEQSLIRIMHMKISNDHGSIALKKCFAWNVFFLNLIKIAKVC